MFEKFWANIIRYYTGKVYRPGLTQNQGFETCKGRFCLYSQATALERQRRGRVSRLVASGARFLIAEAGVNLDFSNNLLHYKPMQADALAIRKLRLEKTTRQILVDKKHRAGDKYLL